MAARTSLPVATAEATSIGELLERDPGVMAVLEAAGIRLDPFTIIALRCTPEELAEYSALRDPGELRWAIEERARR